MSTPKRIQRQRTKGWRMPEGAVYVGRPTRWGNRWRIGADVVDLYRDWINDELSSRYPAARESWIQWFLEPLRGKDLACWCPLDQPCHADVLLELANREAVAA